RQPQPLHDALSRLAPFLRIGHVAPRPHTDLGHHQVGAEECLAVLLAERLVGRVEPRRVDRALAQFAGSSDELLGRALVAEEGTAESDHGSTSII
ncbi:MAG: hypothetical protein GW802_18835, partial [Armatimonadetes bacterium]|nr:hypothetical protein [Armatimonadota bacterium]